MWFWDGKVVPLFLNVNERGMIDELPEQSRNEMTNYPIYSLL